MIALKTASMAGGNDGRNGPETVSHERSPELEMLTPKGEHFIPCSTRVMFDGRISLDGIATAKTL